MKATRFELAMVLALWLIIPIAYILQGQDANWDLQNYHLYNTISLFDHSLKNDTAPAGIQTYFNPLVSLPAYWIHHLSATPRQAFWFGLVLAGFQGLTGPVVYALARLTLGAQRSVCFLAALIGLTSPMLLSEAGTSFADLTLCVLQLGSLLLACLALRAPPGRANWLLAVGWGMFGAATGLKFTAIFLLPLLLLVSVGGLLERRRSMSLWRTTAGAILVIALPLLIGFALFAALWLIRSGADNGNPFFPLFSFLFGPSRIFHADNHSDTKYMVRTLADLFSAAGKELILKPIRSEQPYRDLRPSLWVYGTLLALLATALTTVRRGRGHGPTTRLLPEPTHRLALFQVGLLSSYGICLIAAGMARYLLPIQALSGIALVIGIELIARSLPADLVRRRLLLPAMTLFCVASLATMVVPNWGRSGFSVKWNSLLPIDRAGYAGTTLIPFNGLFRSEGSVILLQQPMGWLKQYIGPAQSLHIMIDDLRPEVVERIKARLRREGNRFEVADLVVDGTPLDPHKEVSLLEESFRFRTGDCRMYTTPPGSRIKVCEARLLP